ncbi:unnamed protein product [Dovyalis caffra]|uniref:Peptidase C19 ubiquitin carboxyl-terminal hydrolase domain-containing protein n=1 Tax=Dovyalis caffra TaxID=77055 RepID=A0AAV1RQL8_9ROSI|nr:unnamed protein product [Dovyalis caffra]
MEASGNEEQFPLYHKNAEKLYTLIASDSGSLDSATNVSTSTNNLKPEEEELHSKIGFENCDKSLEDQRQFENRTRQNYLAEMNKKADGVTNDLPRLSKVNYVDGSGIFGAGLKNDGENNCFLNVIIQCLWNIQPVRYELSSISDSGHEHVGDPCIVCGLAEVFGKLSEASTSFRREIGSTTSLRTAIGKWSPHRDLFQEVCKENVEYLFYSCSQFNQ